MKTIAKLLLAGVVSGMIFSLDAAAQDQKSENDPAQFARGAKAWADQCGRCHNVRAPSELNDSDWHVSITHMRVRANIPGDMARDIAAFLKASNDRK